VEIDGTVYNDIAGAPPLAGWTVQISGPVNASTQSDASGHYIFSGIPAGSYVVCEVVPSGWRITWPTMSAPCSSGLGYTFSLTAGGGASFVDFGNVAL
jgi:carboxypeptidase family protein